MTQDAGNALIVARQAISRGHELAVDLAEALGSELSEVADETWFVYRIEAALRTMSPQDFKAVAIQCGL